MINDQNNSSEMISQVLHLQDCVMKFCQGAGNMFANKCSAATEKLD